MVCAIAAAACGQIRVIARLERGRERANAEEQY